jgi:ribosome-binding factor A
MSVRLERVAAQVKRDLGEMFLREITPGVIVTITQVRMTEDLSIAKVYLSVFSPSGNAKEIFENLRNREKEFRTKLAQKMRNQLRRMPEVHFIYDDTADYVNRIEAIFKKINTINTPGTDEAS